MGAENTGWFELGEGDLPELQRFIEANPQYWRVVMEREPSATAAREMFDDRPPDDWVWERQWLVALRDAASDMIAMAEITEGMLAAGVWHVGLFITAARLHGTGRSEKAYAALERWMRASGARWVRLGVVVGNARAERFWEKAGFTEVKRRCGIEVEGRERDLRVMAKALGDASLREYLALVERDRSG
jgi:GNAT superfamily N-acetyltransferase